MLLCWLRGKSTSYSRDNVKFLLDANLPLGLADIISQQFKRDCYRISSSLTDEIIIQQAKKEDRILLTLDTDLF